MNEKEQTMEYRIAVTISLAHGEHTPCLVCQKLAAEIVVTIKQAGWKSPEEVAAIKHDPTVEHLKRLRAEAFESGKLPDGEGESK